MRILLVASSPTSFDPRQLAKLRGLRLRARHVVEGYIAGQHRSPLHGYSIEFAEHREYSQGDDLRHLDWKVFGRTDKFYLKQYEDETNLLCHLVVDTSESMTYQSSEAAMSKAEFAQCLAASLAWLVLQQQDSVGLATFDSQIRADSPQWCCSTVATSFASAGKLQAGDEDFRGPNSARTGRATEQARRGGGNQRSTR